MRPTNAKSDRVELLEKFTPENFETYEDYFYYLHLNNNVRYMHLVGMVGGLIFLPFAFYLMTWWAFAIYIALFYGFGYISHLIFDGMVSKTAAEAPWKSFIYATKINLLCLRPKYVAELDRLFYEKYPFVEEVYPRQ